MKIKGRACDSLWYYSQLFNLPLSLLIDSNPHLNINDTLQDQGINIPGYSIKQYEVTEKDFVKRIKNEFNINLDVLALLNTNCDFAKLKKNDWIYIPEKIVKPVVNGKKNYDYKTMISDLRLLQEIYPFLKINNFGRSVLNKNIPEIQVGRGDKRVHMNGSFHANEWITTAVLMTLLNDYLLSLTNRMSLAGVECEHLYHCVTLSLVPMVNPDGVDLVLNGLPSDPYYMDFVLDINNGSDDFLNWKANINGVDLNNQFPAKWELEKPRKPQSPSPRDYPGKEPLSEPESIAMAALAKASNFDRVIAFHTQCKEIYWGFADKEPRYAETIVKEFEKVSGYVPVQTLDSYAGFKDWFIYEWGKPGYTVELGEGVNPLPIDQFPDIYSESLGIFLASLYM